VILVTAYLKAKRDAPLQNPRLPLSPEAVSLRLENQDLFKFSSSTPLTTKASRVLRHQDKSAHRLSGRDMIHLSTPALTRDKES
jgi:hypothetical protein